MPTPEPHHREHTAIKVVAAALAAVTATLAASFLGVAGTVIGAAVASVVATLGNAVYSHSLHRTHARVRTDAATDHVFLPQVRPEPAPAFTTQEKVIDRGRPAFAHVAAGAVALFAVVLALVTGVELMAGRPVSDIVRGDAGAGTSLFGTAGSGQTSRPSGVPTVTRTVTPSVVVTTPTVTRTAAPVTTTTTPTSTPTGPPTSPTPSTGASGPNADPSGASTQLG